MMNYSLITALTSVAVAAVAAFAEPVRAFVVANPGFAAALSAVATIVAAAQNSFLNRK